MATIKAVLRVAPIALVVVFQTIEASAFFFLQIVAMVAPTAHYLTLFALKALVTPLHSLITLYALLRLMIVEFVHCFASTTHVDSLWDAQEGISLCFKAEKGVK